jgi:hypothetical protein
MKTLLLAAALACAASVSTVRAEPAVLLNGEVRVTADPLLDARTRMTELDIAISDGTREFHVRSRHNATPGDALAAQRVHTAWKDSYLFVRDTCVDATKPPRCDIDHVFTWAGTPRALAYVGEVYAGEDCITEPVNGCALWPKSRESEDLFTDIHQIGDGATVSLLQQLRVARTALGAQFVVDLEQTWRSNEERFRAGEDCINAATGERDKLCVDGIAANSALMFNAALAKYTKRDDALAQLRTRAKPILCGGDTNCAALRALEETLSSIKPGERIVARKGAVTVRMAPLPKR